MQELPHIPVFLEEAHPCPYLPNELCSNLRFYLRSWTPEFLEMLLENGFRHFGGDFFRPHCAECNRCSGLRIAVDTFRHQRIHRRLLQRNSDLRMELFSTPVDAQRIELLNNYQGWRSQTRDWPPSNYSAETYCDSFAPVEESSGQIGYRDRDGQLLAVSVVDFAARSLNAVYHYYDPRQSTRSLGTWMVLQEIELAQRRSLQWVQLGIYNSECPSLAYKARFRPHELLVDGDWRDPALPLACND